MATIKKLFVFLLAAAVMPTVTLAGCSGPNSGGDGQAADPGRSGKLTIVSSESGQLVSWQDGQPSGFEFDLMHAVADDLGLELNYIRRYDDNGWLTPEASLGRVDASAEQVGPALALPGNIVAPDKGYDIREERRSIPYFEDNLVCLVMAGSGLESLADLSGRLVGVNGSPDGNLDLPGMPVDVSFRLYSSQADGLAALQAGLVDALVMPEYATDARNGFYDKYHNVKPIGLIPTGYEYVLLFGPDNPELYAAVNQSLQGLVDDGRYSAIFARYFSYEPSLAQQNK